jgi:hypothetical protein
MAEESQSHRPTWHLWVFVAMAIGSLLPLLFLRLDVASQLGSALALPLAVLLTAMTTVPVIRDAGRPFPWGRFLMVGATLVAILGLSGVGYAVWQNTKDIPVNFNFPENTSSTHWTDGSYYDLEIPGKPPQRGHVSVLVSLTNVNAKSSDCILTGTIEFTPIIDGRPGDAVTGTSVHPVDVSLAGTARDAKVRMTLHYDAGNKDCQVDLHVDRTVLHD